MSENDLQDVTGKRVELLKNIYRADGNGTIERKTLGTVEYPLDSVGRKCLWVTFDTGVSQLIFLHEVSLVEN